MNYNKTKINGLYVLENFYSKDQRGSFTKIFNKDDYKNLELDMDIEEVFYSRSNKDVIRGMHFQIPPYEQSKIVTVIKGKVQDVIIDLRRNSDTYGQCEVFELNENNNKSIFIPKGCAHGFKSLENNTIMMYMVSSVHNQKYDSGIKWNSIDFNWNIEKPIVSEKDNKLIEFKKFKSPF